MGANRINPIFGTCEGYPPDMMIINPYAFAAATESFTPDFIETFDTTGYDNSGWTETGTVNEDYTTSPAPLEGAQSCHIAASGNIERGLTSAASAYFYAVFNFPTVPSSAIILDVQAAGRVDYCARLASAGNNKGLSIKSGSGAYTPSLDIGHGTITNGNTFHIWIEFVKNTSLKLFLANSATKPSSPGVEITSSVANYNVGYLKLYGHATIWDQIIVHSSAIPSNPTA